jgi:endoglucanase
MSGKRLPSAMANVATNGSAPPTGSLSRRGVLQRALAAIAIDCFVTRGAALARDPTKRSSLLRGVSLAGAEFGQLVPGQHGRDYIYPTRDDFKYCADLGFNVVRLPFKWDRLQPDLNGAFDDQEWQRVSEAIATARQFKLTLILDPHNYARRRIRDDQYTVDHLIGGTHVPTSAFASFWTELARRTRTDAHVIYALMNEPYDIAAEAWLEIASATLHAIRATGAKQMVLVPGVAYTGAHSWISAGNTRLEALRDPAENFAIEVHQYLDDDSSGTSGEAVSESIGPERLAAFVAWARTAKVKAFLGEFGGGPSAKSQLALAAIVDAVESNPDVWIGWAAWAAGPWWPDEEPMRLSRGRDGTIPPQMKLLSKEARKNRS